MQGQQRREEFEETHEEVSSDVEEDIRKMLNKRQQAVKLPGGAGGVMENEFLEALALMKQLSSQYDEIEGYLKKVSENRDVEAFPVEVIGTFVKSTKISPTLIKIVSSTAEENKNLHKEIAKSKKQEDVLKEQLKDIAAAEKTKKLETKYLEQAVQDAAKELKIARNDALIQRKKILELEAALETQKKIGKELLREKSGLHKERDIHEEEKSLLRKIIEEKDAEAEDLKRKEEEMRYEMQRVQRDNEILQIQYQRQKKRAEVKEKALSMCNLEMERMIKQLDKLTKMDTQKKEKLEHLSIIKKRLEHENKTLYNTRTQGRTREQEEKREAPDHRRGRDSRKKEDAWSSSEGTSERATDIPPGSMSYSQAVEDASLPSSHSELEARAETESESSTGEKTTTSFKEMQRKTEEMTQRFRELENLLQEIKKGNDKEMNKVEEKTNRYTRRKEDQKGV